MNNRTPPNAGDQHRGVTYHALADHFDLFAYDNPGELALLIAVLQVFPHGWPYTTEHRTAAAALVRRGDLHHRFDPDRGIPVLELRNRELLEGLERTELYREKARRILRTLPAPERNPKREFSLRSSDSGTEKRGEGLGEGNAPQFARHNGNPQPVGAIADWAVRDLVGAVEAERREAGT